MDAVDNASRKRPTLPTMSAFPLYSTLIFFPPFFFSFFSLLPITLWCPRGRSLEKRARTLSVIFLQRRRQL